VFAGVDHGHVGEKVVEINLKSPGEHLSALGQGGSAVICFGAALAWPCSGWRIWNVHCVAGVDAGVIEEALGAVSKASADVF
jgi:hypothetical protein